MEYRTSAGEVLLTGTVVIDTSPNSVSGIRCQCCGDVVSCSQFEAHAGELTAPAPRPHTSSCCSWADTAHPRVRCVHRERTFPV